MKKGIVFNLNALVDQPDLEMPYPSYKLIPKSGLANITYRWVMKAYWKVFIRDRLVRSAEDNQHNDESHRERRAA